MNKIELDDKQTACKTVMEKIINKELTTKQAALAFCVTQRCIEYKVNAYKEKGENALIHGNTGKFI